MTERRLAAKALDVSLERARQLIRDGRLDALQVSGRWLVDPVSVDQLTHEQRRAGRPWAAARAWGLLALAADRDAEQLLVSLQQSLGAGCEVCVGTHSVAPVPTVSDGAMSGTFGEPWTAAVPVSAGTLRKCEESW